MGSWGIKHYLTCVHCKTTFLDKNGEKTSGLKRGKAKFPFCNRECAMRYYCGKRDEQKCRRCKKSRKELSVFPNSHVSGIAMNNGFCPSCYRLRLVYNKDEKLIRAHELTQTLKKETANAIRNTKHKRSKKDATGIDRCSSQGKSRSSSSPGYKCSFFSHITISPVGL